MRSYVIERICPRTGYTERTNFYGTLKQKPKGWKIVKEA